MITKARKKTSNNLSMNANTFEQKEELGEYEKTLSHSISLPHTQTNTVASAKVLTGACWRVATTFRVLFPSPRARGICAGFLCAGTGDKSR